uniref:uncharacterized protein LOC122606793 n=1 Tax=Erigeron canadensis TaxID=72917 RepID=UPI001CB8931F|nr:uncharacterized protein LOC122606793 [Erigeron canadensis]
MCSSRLLLWRTLVIRSLHYCCVVDSDDDPVKDYYKFSSVLPRKLEEGLPGKTLTTYQSHFCRNLCRPRKVGSILEIHSGSAKCSCFTICLKSVHTADLDYAFEFFWPRGRNYLIVLESLLSILKMCLPSFKFPFGAELGEELCILDVENSTKSISGSFKIFKGDRLSNTLGAMEETRSIADEAGQQYESTLEESERGTNDQWLRPKHAKRKLSGLSDGEDEADIDRFWDSDHDMLIEVYYKNEFALFHLCSSYTLANVRKIIEEKFMLDPGTYGLGYQTKEWGWAVLNTDEKLANCKKHSRRDQKSRFKVSVLPLPPRGFSVQHAKPLYELFSGKRKFLSTKVSK